MAFTVPIFPLLANVYTSTAPYPAPARLTAVPCNLAWGKRVAVPSTGGTAFLGVPLFTMTLLLPILTDVRGPLSATGPDQVEVPAGSGRIYQVVYVDDLGKGFLNEHRGALILAIAQPTPLT